MLFGSLVLSALHLPQDLLRDAGVVVLVVIGLSLLIPRLADLLARPFERLPQRRVDPDSNGIVLGLGLGLLYVPCAGPVLATIAVVGATHHVGLGAVLLTISFGIGAGVPLLAIALAGDAIVRRTGILRQRARAVRLTGGVVMILAAAVIGLNLTDGLQRHVPGYTTALQNSIENNGTASKQLQRLTTTSSSPGPGEDAACTEGGATLENCGQAPGITGITGWLNTAGDRPLTAASLAGKVVLVDFWTYSCINCQRSLPHLEAWYRSYSSDGFVVVGVHTPEFAFEHVTSNVRAQAASLGVKYPIAIDNNYATWQAFSNQYWPAEYLIDPSGIVRHVSFGEGDYGTTESLIRQLLTISHPGVALPAATDVPDTTPTEQQTPETYLGYMYAPLRTTGAQPANDKANAVRVPEGAAAGHVRVVRHLDGPIGGRGRRPGREPGVELSGRRRLSGARRHRLGHGERQRCADQDHSGDRRAQALHPRRGCTGCTGAADPGHESRRPGLRLHVRIAPSVSSPARAAASSAPCRRKHDAPSMSPRTSVGRRG